MKARKKLVVSICVLVMTIILATGTTFAWITMNNRATVDGFDINIGSKSNALDISVDGKNYFNDLSQENLMSAMGLSYNDSKKQILADGQPWSMEQVTYISKSEIVADTSGKLINENEEQIIEPGYYTLKNELGTPNTTYKEVKKNNGGRYLSVKLYLRSNASIAQEVYLFSEKEKVIGNKKSGKYSSIVTPEKDENEAKKSAVTFGEKKLGENLGEKYGANAVNNYMEKTTGEPSFNVIYSRAAYATRIGFLTKEDDPKKVGTKIDKMQVFDPYKFETDNPSFYNENLARDISALTYTTTIPSETLYSTPKSDDIALLYSQEENSSNIKSLFKLEYNSDTGFYEKEVTVTIWLEGRDGDCFSGVIEDSFSVNLNFVALPKGTTK